MKHIGNLEVTKDSKFEHITEVTGDVYVYGDAKLDALQKKNDEGAKLICKAALELSFSLKGMIRIDGILSWLIDKKTIGDVTAFEIKIVGKLNTSFAVQRGDVFSHGETIEKAIEDLRYKIGNRDASEFEKWRGKLDTEITIDEAIAAYRVITGACEYGVKDFVKSIQMPDKLTPNVVLAITKGKFGNDTFRKFLVV